MSGFPFPFVDPGHGCCQKSRMSLPSQPTALKATALLGALAVGLGAFGAHGLEILLAETGRTEIWKTAAAYHLIHAVLLFVVATRENWRPLPWTLLSTGILVFSGSLYLLCLTGIAWLGAITPLGGLLLIAGWLALIAPSHDKQGRRKSA
jgi:uncharacterized membrane protein YgdD (TMEM256/DUF423 family)